MRAFSRRAKEQGKIIGFVPTMGYLHEGHLSLVEAARAKTDIVVVSIFVNPAQFGPKEDLSKYPRNFKRDKLLLSSFNVDVLFLPSSGAMYPKGFCSYVEVEGISNKLCGRARPGHFRGVATVVAKLFNVVSPDFAFFGEKDFQQQFIIKRMVKDLDLPVQVLTLPTIREFDGLAMSSRNKYLTPEQRRSAPRLYKALLLAREIARRGERSAAKLIAELIHYIKKDPNIKIEQIRVVDPHSLEELKKIKKPALVLLAAFIGKARLIDNLLIT